MADAVVDLAPLDGATETTETTQGDSFETQSTDQSQQTDQSSQQQQDQQQVDGRRGPANVRGAIKTLSETAPEHAGTLKELGNSYFREQAYKQAFPTPQEATNAKQLIEGIGGVEGAAALTQRIQGYDAQDAALKEGSPEVLDAFFKDFPEGAAALAPHYLDRLSQANPQAFKDAIAPHAIAMLEQAGIGNHLLAIQNETDPARQKGLINQLAEWFKGQSANVAQIKQNSTQAKNPAAEKLAKDREALDTEKETIFKSAVQGKVNTAVEAPIKSTVEQYTKTNKWNEKQAANFRTTLENTVIAEMQKDDTFNKQVNLRYANKTRTHDTVASYISGEFNRRMKDQAFKVSQEVNVLYGKQAGVKPGTGQVKPTTAQTAPGGGPMLVSQRPPDSELDFNRPDAEMNLIKGRAWTKGGKFVTWRKATA